MMLQLLSRTNPSGTEKYRNIMYLILNSKQ